MVYSQKEIAIINENGKILRRIVRLIKKLIKPGVSTEFIESEAKKYIKRSGAKSSFKKRPTKMFLCII